MLYRLTWLAAVIAIGTSAGQAQVLTVQRPAPVRTQATSQPRLDPEIARALVTNLQPGPKATAPGAIAVGIDPAISAILRQQSAAAQSILAAGSRVQAVALNPQPLPPRGAATSTKTFTGNLRPVGQQVGPSKTMSATGNTATAGATTAVAATPATGQSGPTRPQPSAQGSSSGLQGAAAQAPSPLCMGGITSVDGKKWGIVVSPVPGPEGTFVIQGCGFGSTPGVVYLSGMRLWKDAAAVSGIEMARTTVTQTLGQSPNEVGLRIAPNGWSDRQITVSIDPNLRGYFDTGSNVTLVVKTANGQQYERPGNTFHAAREAQLMTWIPNDSLTTGVAHLADQAPVSAGFFPSSEFPYLAPGHTGLVVRKIFGAFNGGQDQIEVWSLLGPYVDQFYVHMVQIFPAPMTSFDCGRMGGKWSANGNWSVRGLPDGSQYPKSYAISWQEQSCETATQIQGVSAYGLDIWVVGPRGVSPWKDMVGYQRW